MLVHWIQTRHRGLRPSRRLKHAPPWSMVRVTRAHELAHQPLGNQRTHLRNTNAELADASLAPPLSQSFIKMHRRKPFTCCLKSGANTKQTTTCFLRL
jgi:hypothetical protein